MERLLRYLKKVDERAPCARDASVAAIVLPLIIISFPNEQNMPLFLFILSSLSMIYCMRFVTLISSKASACDDQEY